MVGGTYQIAKKGNSIIAGFVHAKAQDPFLLFNDFRLFLLHSSLNMAFGSFSDRHFVTTRRFILLGKNTFPHPEHS